MMTSDLMWAIGLTAFGFGLLLGHYFGYWRGRLED